jgi:hypothetical protein
MKCCRGEWEYSRRRISSTTFFESFAGRSNVTHPLLAPETHRAHDIQRGKSLWDKFIKQLESVPSRNLCNIGRGPQGTVSSHEFFVSAFIFLKLKWMSMSPGTDEAQATVPDCMSRQVLISLLSWADNDFFELREILQNIVKESLLYVMPPHYSCSNKI